MHNTPTVTHDMGKITSSGPAGRAASHETPRSARGGSGLACQPCLCTAPACCIVCHCLPAVVSGSNATVTCSKAPNATWPAGGFVVSATATASSSGCTGSSKAQTVVAVAVPTAVTLAAPQDPASTIVCPTAVSRVLNYTFSTMPAGIGLSNVTLTSSGANCSVASPTNGRQAGEHRVFS